MTPLAGLTGRRKGGSAACLSLGTILLIVLVVLAFKLLRRCELKLRAEVAEIITSIRQRRR